MGAFCYGHLEHGRYGMDAEQIIRDALGTMFKSQRRIDELVNPIYDALEKAGCLIMGDLATVEVCGARLAVDGVEAYGLSISLDAHGNAVDVSSPHGMFVSVWD
jgi:hypothetical protein